MNRNYLLSLDALIRAVNVNKDVGHSLFLGAGASITSGVKSAYDCIWDWKRELFLSNNPGLEPFFSDSSVGYVRDRIQEWLDEKGEYPPRDDDSEYSFYIEQAFPIADDRRQFFQRLLQGVSPHVGYHLFCILAEEGIIQSVWTTNFDRLTVTAAKDHEITPIEVGLDSVNRLQRPIRRGELLEIAIHGDYKYDSLKNTTSELEGQDPNLSNGLSMYLKDHHLIVNGYSGRDDSIMNVLLGAYSQPGVGRLYWCGYSEVPNSKIEHLIEVARANGREAFYIGGVEFDELAIRLSRYCLTGQRSQKATEYYEKFKELKGHTPPFSLSFQKVNGVIKSNLFPIQLPREVFQFSIDFPEGRRPWEFLREIRDKTGFIGVPLKGKVLSFATQTKIFEVFPKVIGDIERTPIVFKELRYQDSHIMHLLNATLVDGISFAHGVETNHRSTIWEREPIKEITIAGQKVFVHQSASLQLRVILEKCYFTIHPSYRLFLENGEVPPPDIAFEGKRILLEKQRNKEYNEAVTYWRNKLFPEIRIEGKKRRQKLSFEYPIESGSGFRFQLGHSPIFAEIDEKGNSRSTTLNPAFKPLFQQRGIQFEEPRLVFSSLDGRAPMEDIHPIRGLLQNRPFDFPVTSSNLFHQIKLGVVAPKSFHGRLLQFLNKQHSQIRATVAQNYLLDFPGFENAYGLPIVVPSENSSLVEDCPHPNQNQELSKVALQMAHAICDRIEQLFNRERPNVIVVFIPQPWRAFSYFKTEHERFDLHDYIKAFAAQRGIATQLLEEKTLSNSVMACPIHWWLSLSFYFKSLRTPWILKGLETETAYVGLGFGIDTTAMEGSILMGCSQIFNSSGQGMQFRLSRVNDFTFRRGNPFLSRAEAHRLGNSIRQMFFESLGKIPERVVIHKRTAYSHEEKQGLLEGLGSIDNVDLVELNFEPSLRYVASSLKWDGKYSNPAIDGYPTRRGTCVLTGKYEALLWSHGTVPSVKNPNYKFYKGGRRIPAPIKLIKHHGPSNIELLAKEILGLSKMNWNTMDLYAQLPITIYSSNQIAKIGSLLSRFENGSYDYRYFI